MLHEKEIKQQPQKYTLEFTSKKKRKKPKKSSNNNNKQFTLLQSVQRQEKINYNNRKEDILYF